MKRVFCKPNTIAAAEIPAAAFFVVLAHLAIFSTYFEISVVEKPVDNVENHHRKQAAILKNYILC